jgi:DNA-binding transcriptional LysR family regulator
MPSVDVDLRKIRYFVAVADNLHFRKAAEELHIAQPALSRSIGALERELGTQLFVRDKRSVILTPAGRQLLDDAGPLLAAADATRGDRRSASSGVGRPRGADPQWTRRCSLCPPADPRTRPAPRSALRRTATRRPTS